MQPSSVPIRLLDVVALMADLPEHGLQRGQVGTVVEEWAEGVLEVEFAGTDGRAYAFVAVEAAKLLPLRYAPEATAP